MGLLTRCWPGWLVTTIGGPSAPFGSHPCRRGSGRDDRNPERRGAPVWLSPPGSVDSAGHALAGVRLWHAVVCAFSTTLVPGYSQLHSAFRWVFPYTRHGRAGRVRAGLAAGGVSGGPVTPERMPGDLHPVYDRVAVSVTRVLAGRRRRRGRGRSRWCWRASLRRGRSWASVTASSVSDLAREHGLRRRRDGLELSGGGTGAASG